MATCTHRISTASTANATSYASGAFTPAAGELLVAFVIATGTVAAAPTMVDSGGLTMAFIPNGTAGTPTVADTTYTFVSTGFAAAASRTVTFDCTADAATGCVILVLGITGMFVAGAAAIRNNNGFPSFIAGATPTTGSIAPVPLVTNPTLCLLINQTNPATVTPPTNWTEQNDTGYATPTTGVEYATRDSGYGVTTAITWGSTSATAGAAAFFEFNADRVPFYRNQLPSLIAQMKEYRERKRFTFLDGLWRPDRRLARAA